MPTIIGFSWQYGPQEVCGLGPRKLTGSYSFIGTGNTALKNTPLDNGGWYNESGGMSVPKVDAILLNQKFSDGLDFAYRTARDKALGATVQQQPADQSADAWANAI